ncbi:MAG: sigma-70 family RNA polymerase sigma factor [Gemmatimonadetes bacterium]|nr:sigma-70 family RNA polymerase sigma factor [Gemmatimonadota bacterium]
MTSPADITQRLRQAQEGDRGALDEVFGLVYEELHRQARAQRRRWSGDHTLDTTALVHEAYLKLVGQPDASWNDRGHFLAVAARAMRHLLVNYAERRRAAKRGGGASHISLEDREAGSDSSTDFNPVSEEVADELIALNEALERLGAVNERQVSVVEARFYVGLSIEETAQALGLSPATVKRDWQVASAWLHREIQTTLDMS